MAEILQAGRELDALIAERLFGWTWWRSASTGRRALFVVGAEPSWFQQAADMTEKLASHWDQFPEYSTDISAAWEVVEWLRANYDSVSIYYDSRDGYWELDCCEHIDYDTGKRDDGSEPRLGCAIASGETPALAICRTALQAVERAAQEGRTPLAIRRAGDPA